MAQNVQGHVLVDGQRLPARVPGDELQLRVGQAAVPGQESNRL